MKIGIIGAGFIGRAVAQHAVRCGHDVMISNSRNPKTLGSTMVAIGCKAGTSEEAAAFGDLVVIAIPFNAYKSVPVDSLAGKIVVDANNYYPARDGQIGELDSRKTTTSEMLARHLRGAKVVKGFNAILQNDLVDDGRPKGASDRRALPIVGDDAAAKKAVANLLDQFGFDVVDAGPLSAGWRFERAKPAYCVPLDVAGLERALAEAKRDVDLPHGSWRRASQ